MSTHSTGQALVSIHDVMPETLDRVFAIIETLNRWHVRPVTLLIVPGKPWTEVQLAQVRDWATRGHPLAAHGWHHQTEPRKLYHRLHAALISRKVAEHLDLDSAGVLDLLKRSKQWFADHELPVPDFYVPPAWALGPITKTDLARAPFGRIETTRGVLFPSDTGKHRFRKLPLTGFEADTWLRAAFLRRWNAQQARSAARKQTPLRISIHPDDLQLRVADQMEALLTQRWSFIDYASLD